MDDRNRPASTMISPTPEAGPARAQGDLKLDATDPYKHVDRNRLDQSFRQHLRRHRASGLDWHLDNLRPSMGGELWVEGRSLTDRVQIVQERDRIVEACQTEIERLLVEPLLFIGRRMDCSVSYRIGEREYGTIAGTHIGGHLCIQPQCLVPPYRLDFVVTYRQDVYEYRFDATGKRRQSTVVRESQLVIECDGREWHEKTPAQTERDRGQDRALQARGYLVFRYTGSMITRDPYKCVYEALGALLQRPGAADWSDVA